MFHDHDWSMENQNFVLVSFSLSLYLLFYLPRVHHIHFFSLFFFILSPRNVRVFRDYYRRCNFTICILPYVFARTIFVFHSLLWPSYLHINELLPMNWGDSRLPPLHWVVNFNEKMPPTLDVNTIRRFFFFPNGVRTKNKCN